MPTSDGPAAAPDRFRSPNPAGTLHGPRLTGTLPAHRHALIMQPGLGVRSRGREGPYWTGGAFSSGHNNVAGGSHGVSSPFVFAGGEATPRHHPVSFAVASEPRTGRTGQTRQTGRTEQISSGSQASSSRSPGNPGIPGIQETPVGSSVGPPSRSFPDQYIAAACRCSPPWHSV